MLRPFQGGCFRHLVEDAAHSFPASYRSAPDRPWRRCGEYTAAATCYWFYANKTITTGEGGMAVTDDEGLAKRMKAMSLHGLSHDAWNRFGGGNNGWDYKIVAPGFKYNMTDIAAAIGIHQLRRAEAMREQREAIAAQYFQQLGDVAEIELPEDPFGVSVFRCFGVSVFRCFGVSVFRSELPNTGHRPPKHRFTWQRLISVTIFPGMPPDELARRVGLMRGLSIRANGADQIGRAHV